MIQGMTTRVLEQENRVFRGTGGVSAANRSLRFHPAFRDSETNRIYPSCFSDGRRAPFHLLDGLPDELVLVRDATGRVVVVKPSVSSGFERDGQFFSRDEAASLVSGERADSCAFD